MDHGKIERGQPVEMDWMQKDLLFECCDCGLVHRLHFVVIEDRLIIQGWRDEKKTEAKRKKNKRAKSR